MALNSAGPAMPALTSFGAPSSSYLLNRCWRSRNVAITIRTFCVGDGADVEGALRAGVASFVPTACGRWPGAGETGSPHAADPATRVWIRTHIINRLDVIRLPRSIATFGWPNTQLAHAKQERGDWFPVQAQKKKGVARQKKRLNAQKRT